jgi:FkbM family methyltransferase
MLNMKKEDFKMIEYINQISSIKGIIQVGANSGQEVGLFKKFTNNIILIEPIPQLANYLNQIHPDCLVIPHGLGSTNTQMDLYLASNGGESSSVLKPINHIVYYPDVLFQDSIKIQVRTFGSLIDEYNININNFNILISDTQGYDLEAIKGFGDYIKHFELIIAEYINSNLYENEASLESITNYLSPMGFELTNTYDENLGAGNAAFIKKI